MSKLIQYNDELLSENEKLKQDKERVLNDLHYERLNLENLSKDLHTLKNESIN